MAQFAAKRNQYGKDGHRFRGYRRISRVRFSLTVTAMLYVHPISKSHTMEWNMFRRIWDIIGWRSQAETILDVCGVSALATIYICSLMTF